jgi:DNA-binding CsgD family transcriptional regulator
LQDRRELSAFVGVQAALARLAALPTTAQLIQAAPAELCRCCGFDRAAGCDGQDPERAVVAAAFAGGFGRLLERATARDQVIEQRARLAEALRAAGRVADGPEPKPMLTRTVCASLAITTSGGRERLHTESRVQSLLTPREREVLDLMASGARNSQIAGRLVISEETVKSHVKNVRRKLRATNRAAAVSKYLHLIMQEHR